MAPKIPNLHPYLDPAQHGSLGSVAKYRRATGKSQLEALDDLQQLDAYTIHKPKRSRFKRNPVIVTDSKQQFQADLMDVQKISKLNKHRKYVLVVIDCFSKRACCVPILNKTGGKVAEGFEQVFTELGIPDKLQVDRGETGLGNLYNNSIIQPLWLQVKNFTILL
jgi:hypothetical protein